MNAKQLQKYKQNIRKIEIYEKSKKHDENEVQNEKLDSNSCTQNLKG